MKTKTTIISAIDFARIQANLIEKGHRFAYEINSDGTVTLITMRK